FHDLAIGLDNVRIERGAVGNLRLLEDPVTQGPVFVVELDADAVGVAADIGRVVPGSVVHDGPGQELRARIVTVPIIVHQVAGGEFSQAEDNAVDSALAGDLVGTVLDLLQFVAQGECLPQVESGKVRSRIRHSDAGDLAIGKAGNAGRAAEAAAAGNLGV